MHPDAARLRRLQRLERVRAIARQTALGEAARAEGTLAQLSALAERTQAMSEDYRASSLVGDGHQLRQLGAFVAGLQGISAATANDLAQARSIADARQQDLAQAEHRRAVVEQRARDQARSLAQARAPQALGARRAVGTVLEE